MSLLACKFWGMADSIMEVLAVIAAVIALWGVTHAMCAASSPRESPARAVMFGAAVNVLCVLVAAFLIETRPEMASMPFTGWSFAIGGLLGVGLGALSAYRSDRNKARA